jgi:type IV pilus assembly protein PilB
VEKWKSLASCDVHEKEKPQDGRILTEIDNKQIDLRVSFLPTGLGESLTVRIFDQHVAQIKLKDIDYAPHDRERLLRAIESPNGMIIISGPTGSGKTTVLYACLNHISSPERKTMTVEDPIEYYMPWIVQVPVNSDAGVTFSVALRSILRSDPDVIGIGEIRDLETLEVAQQCAITGHLVITQLHAGEAVRVLNRMVGIGADPFIICESTKLIVCQRLVRKLCPFCSEEQTPPADILERAEKLAFANGLDWDQLQKAFRSPMGCTKCGKTGYRGRNVIAETLEMTPEITIALGQNASIEELQSIAIKQGMTTIAADGLKRASMGLIPLSEVLRVLSLR